MITEILWDIPSHLIATWHNYIWCWQLNKSVSAYAIKRKGAEALVTILYGFIDHLVGIQRIFADVLCHTYKKTSTALNLLISSTPSQHVNFMCLQHDSIWIWGLLLRQHDTPSNLIFSGLSGIGLLVYKPL